MSGEFDIYGVYFPALAVFAAIAFVVQLGMKRLLTPPASIVWFGIARWSIWRST